MAGVSAGSVTVRVVPDASAFASDLRAKIVPQAAQIGAEIGKSIAAGIKKGLGDPLSGPLDESSKQQQAKAPKQGEAVAGAFADAFTKRLKAAFASLPEAKIDADSSDADRKIAELRAQLEELSTKRIGVDIEPGDALAKIAAIKADLDDLAKSSGDIQVRADTAEASAKLAEIGVEAKKVADQNPDIKVDADTAKAIADLTATDAEAKKVGADRPNIKVDADTGDAMGKILSLGIAIAALSAIPVAAPLAAGVGALVPALGAAGLGIGGLAAVALPAFGQIKNAITAQTAAQQQSTQAGAQAQQRALAEAGAQQQLAQAVQNQAYAHTQAVQQVQTAEQQFAASQVTVREAQISLTEARQAEVQTLQDLRNSLVDTGLNVQQDQINVQKAALAVQQLNSAQSDALAIAQAQQQLAQAQSAAKVTLADPNSSATQKAQAQILVDTAKTAVESAQQQAKADDLARQAAKVAYEQAVQQLREEQLAYSRLEAQQKQADQQGVEGSDSVRKAREALASANQQESTSETGLAQARANVYRSDQQAAEQVTSAQRALQEAQLQSSTSTNALSTAMGKLSPSARVLMGQWLGLKLAFNGWSQSLQPTVLPLFGRGIDMLRQSIPYLTPVVTGAARSVNGLITDVGSAAKSPFWTQFRQQMTALVPTAITGLGRAAGNVATGIAGIVKAFIPFAPIVLAFLDKITAGFAKWGKGLGTSSGFAQFMAYVRSVAPLVEHDIALIAGAAAHVVTSLAPLGPLGLSTFGVLARLVKGLSPGEIQAIAVAFIAVKAALAVVDLSKWVEGVKEATLVQKIWTGIVWLWNAAMDGNPIVLIGLLIVALVAAVIYAYTHFATFRAIVQAAWRDIQVAAQWAWNNVLKPAFDGIRVAIMQGVVPAVLWLWHNAIVPAFKAIQLIVGLWWNSFAKPIFTALFVIIKDVVGPVILWLWRAVIALAFNEIKIIIGLAWGLVIRPVFIAINDYIRKILAPSIIWFWQTIVKPTWNLLGTLISWVWTNVIRPAFNALKTALGDVGTAFATGASAIKTAWQMVEKYTKDPINFVIGTVYDKGIVGLWNTVMGWLHLPSNLKLGTIPLLAEGGAIPAQPGVFNKPTAIVGEGNPLHPEYVIPTDPKYRTRAAGLWQAAGSDLQMLAGGGILGDIGGDITSAVKKVAGTVVNLGKNAMDLLANPKAIWDGLVKRLVPSAAGLATGPFGEAATAIPPKLLAEVWTEAQKIFSTFSSAFGGAGGKAMADLALTQVGYHEGAGNANKYTQGLGRGHGEAWCADFIDWLAMTVTPSQSAAIPQTASAPGMARGFGSRFTSGSSGIQEGDIVFFDEGQGSIVHTGIAVTANAGGTWTSVEGNYGDQVAKNRRSEAAGYATPDYKGGTTGSFPGGSLIHASPAAAQAWAGQELVGHGWSAQRGDLINLWNRESGWRWNADNPSSGAYGIPQSLPASKMASAGSDWHDNAATQIKWGLGYIQGRYRDPAGAWAHELSSGWYDEGGLLPTGPSLVYNGTGESEFVFRKDQLDGLLNGSPGGSSTEYHAHFDGWTRSSVQAETRTAFFAMEIANARRERIGRRS